MVWEDPTGPMYIYTCQLVTCGILLLTQLVILLWPPSTTDGRDRSHKVTNRVFILKGNQLKMHPRIYAARFDATAAAEKRTLIIAGSEDNQNQTFPTTELFDSITWQWYIASDLPELKSVIVILCWEDTNKMAATPQQCLLLHWTPCPVPHRWCGNTKRYFKVSFSSCQHT